MELTRLGILDCFIEQGTPDELYDKIGLSAEGIKRSIKTVLLEKTEE